MNIKTQLLNFLNIIDYDNDEIKIIITDVANGTLFINGKEKSNQHTCKKGDNFIWRPEKDTNGIINAFNLILFDGLEYSDVENINVSVEAVDDEIVINKLIDKLNKQGTHVLPKDNITVRAVTNLMVSESQINIALDHVKNAMKS